MPDKLTPLPAIRIFATNENGRVLILQRADTDHGDGLWCLPGGMLDYGETMHQGAQRELREETGLECRELTFEFPQDSLPIEPGGMHCLNLYFSCQVSGSARLNGESRDHAWIGPADVDGYEWAFKNDLGLKRFWREKGLL